MAEGARQSAGGRESDVVAFEAFCHRIQPRLLGTRTLYCGDRHQAEEFTQETLARAGVHWRKVRAARSPEAWAHRVGLNVAHSSYRRRSAERRATTRIGNDLVRHGSADQADTISVRDALLLLPHGQRTAVILRYYAGHSVAETAVLMGCSEGTVKSQTARGIAALRARAGLQGEEALRER